MNLDSASYMIWSLGIRRNLCGSIYLDVNLFRPAKLDIMESYIAT